MKPKMIISKVKAPSVGINGKILEASPEKPAEMLMCEFPKELPSSLQREQNNQLEILNFFSNLTIILCISGLLNWCYCSGILPSTIHRNPSSHFLTFEQPSKNRSFVIIFVLVSHSGPIVSRRRWYDTS